MIKFEEIYQRAVDLIRDPHLSRSRATNTIQFQKEMYPFLRNGINRITAPPQVVALLVEQQPPEGKMEIFQGDGNKSYLLSTNPPADAEMAFYINDKPDPMAVYDPIFNQVTFSRSVNEGETCSCEWYIAGAILADFSKICKPIPVASFTERVTDLLAVSTAVSWGMRERNSLLDGVLNNLTDTDFKVHSPAQSLSAKREWVKEMRLELMNAQQQLGMDLCNQRRRTYGY